jgi:NADH:ubiquinone oxidoreductase subunit 6 (subunit J)
MLIWRGWGLSVILFLVLWLFAAIGLTIGTNAHQPDPKLLSKEMDWGAAIVFALTAGSVFATARYRKSHPRKIVDAQTQKVALAPHVDDFYYIPLQFWSYILLAGAIIFGVIGFIA